MKPDPGYNPETESAEQLIERLSSRIALAIAGGVFAEEHGSAQLSYGSTNFSFTVGVREVSSADYKTSSSSLENEEPSKGNERSRPNYVTN